MRSMSWWTHREMDSSILVSRWVYLSVGVSVCLSECLSVFCLSVSGLHTCLHMSVYLSLSVLSACQSLSVCQSVCVSSLSMCGVCGGAFVCLCTKKTKHLLDHIIMVFVSHSQILMNVSKDETEWKGDPFVTNSAPTLWVVTSVAVKMDMNCIQMGKLAWVRDDKRFQAKLAEVIKSYHDITIGSINPSRRSHIKLCMVITFITDQDSKVGMGIITE